MNSEEFIKGIKQTVHDDVVSNLIEDLGETAGRKPPKKLVRLAEYISNLSENEKSILQRIIAHATHSSIFGLLAVLDGVRAIENSQEKGELKLYWEKGKEKILLNDPHKNSLHDIYQSEVYTEIFEEET